MTKKANVQVPSPPVRLRQILSTDATTESLSLLLRENPHGVCYSQDELTALTGGFNRYRKGIGNDRQFFQSCWTCHEVNIHRVKLVKGARSLDTVRIRLPFISVVGGVQPEMLGELSDERGREDGFIHRFLFAFPYATSHSYDRAGVSEEARHGYQQVVEGLMFRLPASLICDEALIFASEAQERWGAFMESHAAEAEAPDFPDYLRGPLQELVSYCARFALIIHLARYASQEVDSLLVDAISVERAVALTNYFKSHARKTYGQLRNEPRDERLATFLEWVTERGGSVTIRDAVTAKVAGCHNKGEVVALFERATRMGIGEVSSRTNSTGGRATMVFSISGGR